MKAGLPDVVTLLRGGAVALGERLRAGQVLLEEWASVAVCSPERIAEATLGRLNFQNRLPGVPSGRLVVADVPVACRVVEAVSARLLGRPDVRPSLGAEQHLLQSAHGQ